MNATFRNLSRLHLVPARTLVCAALFTAVGCSSSTPGERLQRGTDQFAAGNYSVASIELRNVVQAEPENPEARLLLGLVSLRQGQSAEAVEHLSRARGLGVESGEYAVPLAQALTDVGRAGEALDVLESIAEPDREVAWLLAHGNALFSERRLGAAAQTLRLALERAPDNVDVLLSLVRVTSAQGDTDESERLAGRALELEPERAAAHHFRAELFLAAGNPRVASEFMERAVVLYGQGGLTGRELAAHGALAQINLSLNDRDGLVRTRDRLHARAPDAPVTLYVAAAVDHLDGDYSAAAVKLQAALAGGADDSVQVLVLAGANNLAQGNLGQAEQVLQRALGLQPEFPAAVRLLAETRRRQGRPGAAIDMLRTLPAAMSDPQILALLGVLSLEADQPSEALSYLTLANQAAPRTPALQLQLARAYLALGREAEAVALFGGPLSKSAETAVQVALQLMGEYSVEQDNPAAVARAEQVLAQADGDAATAMGVALFFHATGDSDRARSLMTRSLSIDDAFNFARVTLASLEQVSGRTDIAQRWYEEALDREPDNTLALIGLAQIASAAGANDQAAALLDRAVAAAPDSVSVRLVQLRLATVSGDSARALQLADDAVRAHPDDPDIASIRGILRLGAGNTEGALADLRRAAAVPPHRAERWFNLAQAQVAAGELADGHASLLRARELDGGASATLRLLSQTELQLGNAGAAREAARVLQSVAPDAADGYFLEGNARAAQGAWTEAAALYRQAYQRAAAFDTALRFYTARRESGAGDATELVSAWLETNPDDVRARLIVAEALMNQGDAEAAVRQYEVILEAQPDNVVALNNAAWQLGELGRYARALQYAQRALEAAPEAAPVLDTYGWVLVLDGRVEEGLPYLDKAVRLAPNAPDLRFHLGSAQVRAGKLAEARTTLGTLLRQHPDYVRRAEAEQLLASL
jgi:putative PEP-CTERM system TPR-repeat lipoprotein